MFIGGSGMGTVAPLMPVFASEMGASGIWLGLAFSGFAISQTPLQPVFGRWSDRAGRRWFLAAGFVVYAVVGVAMTLAPGYQALVLLQVAIGVGTALIIPISMAYAAELAPPGREGTFMGLFSLAFFTGWGVGPLVGGSLKDAFGNDGAFLGQTALALLALSIVVARLPESQRRRDLHDGSSLSMLRMLRLRPVQALVAFQSALAFNVGVGFGFIGVYLTDTLGAGASMVGIVIATRVMISGLLQVVGGRLADSWNRKLMIGVGMATASCVTIAIPSMGGVGAIWLLFALIGLAESVSTPAANAIAAETGRSIGMGTLMGTMATALSAGLISGSLAGGVVADLAGIEHAFRFGGLIALAGTGATLALLSGLRTSPIVVSDSGVLPLDAATDG